MSKMNTDNEEPKGMADAANPEVERRAEPDPGVDSTVPAGEFGGSELEEITRLQDQITRLRAEFDNYRKRTQREWQIQRDRAAADAFKVIIPTLDNLEKAIDHAAGAAEAEPTLAAFRDGIVLIYEQLKTALGQEGLECLDLEGQEFDPQVAEAVGVVPAEEGNDLIHTVVQTGWRFRNELIRPAKVLVTRTS